MIEKIYRYSCEDCPTVREYKDKNAARAYGWAIKDGGKGCYCPACALRHRNVGRGGTKKANGEQLSFGEVGNA